MQFNIGFLDFYTLVHLASAFYIGVLLTRKYWYFGIVWIVTLEFIENLLLIYLLPDFFAEELINIISDILFGLLASLAGTYVSARLYDPIKGKPRNLNWYLSYLRGGLFLLLLLSYNIIYLAHPLFSTIYDQFYQIFSIGIDTGSGFILFMVDGVFAIYFGYERECRRSLFLLYEGVNLFLIGLFLSQAIVSGVWTFTIDIAYLIFLFYAIIWTISSVALFVSVWRATHLRVGTQRTLISVYSSGT